MSIPGDGEFIDGGAPGSGPAGIPTEANYDQGRGTWATSSPLLSREKARSGGYPTRWCPWPPRLAQGLGGAAHALLIGRSRGFGAAAQDLGRFGAEKVLVTEEASLAGYHPQGYAGVVSGAVSRGGYAAVVFGATAQGKDLAPRVAALLDVPLASDVTGVTGGGGAVLAERPVFSGKAFASLAFTASPALVSIRPNAFPPVEATAAGIVEAFAPEGLDPGSWTVRVKEFQPSGGSSKDVAEASIVVTGGRGMKGPETLGAPGGASGCPGGRCSPGSFPGRGGRGLEEPLRTGGPDREDRGPKALFRPGDLRCHSTPGGDADLTDHRSREQGPRRPHLPGRGLRDRRGCLPGAAPVDRRGPEAEGRGLTLSNQCSVFGNPPRNGTGSISLP